MRAVLHADVVTAARALLGVPEAQRRRLVEQLFDEATAADAYCRRFGRLHPLWGDGTLRAVAAMRPLVPEPFLSDSTYCCCLMAVFEALLDRRSSAGAREAIRFVRHRRQDRPLQVASPA